MKTDETVKDQIPREVVIEVNLEKCAGAKKAFIEREIQPTQPALAKEFETSQSNISYWCATQNWVGLRSTFQENKRTAAAIVEQAAARVNQPLIDAISGALLQLVHAIGRTISDIDHDKQAASTRAQTCNTCSFALKNIGDTCKSIGIVGMPKALKDTATESGGWTAGLTQQINIMLGKESSEKSSPAPVQPPEADETPLG